MKKAELIRENRRLKNRLKAARRASEALAKLNIEKGLQILELKERSEDA